jgi:molybdopterin-guanine dinucleotide biosynthesis protein A
MSFCAVVLAGGKSSRMGRDKALLEISGQTLLERQIGLAREMGAEKIFISGRAGQDYSVFGCRALRDKFAGAGPLAGIERALAACASPLLLVLAVDLPEMHAKVLRQLFAHCAENRGAIPRVNGSVEPLAAFYPQSARSLARALLRAKENAAGGFAQQCVEAGLAVFVNLPASETEYFANWNSPMDLPQVAKGAPAL